MGRIVTPDVCTALSNLYFSCFFFFSFTLYKKQPRAGTVLLLWVLVNRRRTHPREGFSQERLNKDRTVQAVCTRAGFLGAFVFE